MAKPVAENTRKRAFRGARLPLIEDQRWALHFRRPSRNNICVVSRPGAWGPTCRGPMRLFECVLLLFSLILLLEHILLIQTLDFLNGLKLELVAFSVFGNNRKNGLFVNKDDCMFGLRF